MHKKPTGNQYQAFDALKGYRESLREKEREKQPKKELLQEKIEEINYILQTLKRNDSVEITYYNVDCYKKITGNIEEINIYNKYIKINKLKISIYDIYDIKHIF